MSYCIYLRKSRADAELEALGEGETLARHERILVELAQQRKLNVTKLYREIVSGETISARPVMQQLLNEVEHGLWDGVLVMELERLARGDTMDQGRVSQAFKYTGTQIITPNKIYNPENEFDEEYFEFGLFMSRREYKTINRRLQRGRISSVQEGNFIGSIPPYGYKKVRMANHKGYTLSPIPEQEKIVKLIFHLYAQGETRSDGSNRKLGVASIVRKLNTMGIPSQRGEAWTYSSVNGILHNPVYIGKIRWNYRHHTTQIENGQIAKSRPRADKSEWILTDGRHPAILDETLYETAQTISQKNYKPRVASPKEIKNPLAGLVFCEKCGRRMVRRPYKNGQSDFLICAYPTCDNVSTSLLAVEYQVLNGLEKWLKDYAILFDCPPAQQPKKEQGNTQKTYLLNQLKLLQAQKKNIYDYFEQKLYPPAVFIERMNEVQEKTNAVQQELDLLEKMEKSSGKPMEFTREFLDRVETTLKTYRYTQSPAEKNHLLAAILEKVIYRKERSGRWGNPDNFYVTLYPKLPQKTDDK